MHCWYEWTHSLCAQTAVYHQSFHFQAENTAHRQKSLLKKIHSQQLRIQIFNKFYTTIRMNKKSEEFKLSYLRII